MSGADHLTLDELGELDEGLLAPEHELAARSHLDGCAECRAKAEAIAGTRSALAALGPVAMPGEVTARIEQALSEAAGPSTTGSTGFDPHAAGNVVPDLSEVRNRRRLPSAPTAAAASVAILAVVAIIIGLHGKSSDNSSAGTAASGGSAATQPLVVPTPSGVSQTSFTLTSTGRTYTAANIETLAPALVNGTRYADQIPELSPNSPLPRTTAGSAAGGDKAPKSPTKSGGGSAGGAGAMAGMTAVNGQGLARAAVPAVLRPYQRSRPLLLQCAAFATDTPGAIPEAVDLARWTDPANSKHQVPALIMVFADPVRPVINDVYVEAPPCGSGDLLTLQTVNTSH